MIFEILICWFYFKRPLKRNVGLGQLFHCELLRLLRRSEYHCRHFPRHRQAHCLCVVLQIILWLRGLQILQDEQRWFLLLLFFFDNWWNSWLILCRTFKVDLVLWVRRICWRIHIERQSVSLVRQDWKFEVPLIVRVDWECFWLIYAILHQSADPDVQAFTEATFYALFFDSLITSHISVTLVAHFNENECALRRLKNFLDWLGI